MAFLACGIVFQGDAKLPVLASLPVVATKNTLPARTVNGNPLLAPTRHVHHNASSLGSESQLKNDLAVRPERIAGGCASADSDGRGALCGPQALAPDRNP